MALRPLHLVFDFDGTITLQDTISALADVGEKYQRNRHAAVSPSWAQIVEDYGQDHMEYSSSFRPARDQRYSLEAELNFLRQLRIVELRSLRRVESSGLFQGLDEALLEQEGREAIKNGTVQLRDGFQDIMAAAFRNKWHVSVLSVNWSTAFLRGVLQGYPIHDYIANDIRIDGRIAGPVVLGPCWQDSPMMTCEDKREALVSLLQQVGSSTRSMVYLGDSTCDIECLTLGRGVVVSSSPASILIETLRRVGFDVPAVTNAGCSANLVWAQTFRDVLDSSFLWRKSDEAPAKPASSTVF